MSIGGRGHTRIAMPLALIVFMLVFFVPMAPRVALAHDAVVSSTPADGAEVAQFPREIVLEFSGVPQSSFNTVAVSDATTSTVLFNAKPQLDQKFVSVTTPTDINPGPGEYMVGFQITSSDGHATRGKITFRVTGEKQTVDSSEKSEEQASQPSADASATSILSTWLFVCGGVALALLIATVVTIIVKRK